MKIKTSAKRSRHQYLLLFETPLLPNRLFTLSAFDRLYPRAKDIRLTLTPWGFVNRKAYTAFKLARANKD
jgi:hypothetical protein